MHGATGCQPWSITRQWAEEWGPKGVLVNAVCAGLVKTDAFLTLRALFGETAGVALVVAAHNGTGAVLARANDLGVPARVIGRTGGERLRLRVNGQVAIDEPVARCAATWRGALEARLGVA